ncbi:MAG: hypothetical protein ABFS56_22410 [Pseudomonadota bacterium]
MYALLKSTEKKEIETQQSLGYFLDRAAADKARFTLTYQNKVFVAVVPIEDEELFE